MFSLFLPKKLNKQSRCRGFGKPWRSFDITEIWWRHQMETFPRYWPFVREIHQSPVNSPHKCLWRGTLMFSLIWARINGWVNRKTGAMTPHRAHYDVTLIYDFFVMVIHADFTCCLVHLFTENANRSVGQQCCDDHLVMKWLVNDRFH